MQKHPECTVDIHKSDLAKNSRKKDTGYTTQKPFLCVIGPCNSEVSQLSIKMLYPYYMEIKNSEDGSMHPWFTWYDQYGNKYVSQHYTPDMQDPYEEFVLKYFDPENPQDKNEFEVLEKWVSYSTEYINNCNEDEPEYPLLDKREFPKCEIFDGEVYTCDKQYYCLVADNCDDTKYPDIRITQLIPNYQPPEMCLKITGENLPWYSWSVPNEDEVIGHYRNSYGDQNSVVAWFDEDKEEDRKELELINKWLGEKQKVVDEIHNIEGVEIERN